MAVTAPVNPRRAIRDLPKMVKMVERKLDESSCTIIVRVSLPLYGGGTDDESTLSLTVATVTGVPCCSSTRREVLAGGIIIHAMR